MYINLASLVYTILQNKESYLCHFYISLKLIDHVAIFHLRHTIPI